MLSLRIFKECDFVKKICLIFAMIFLLSGCTKAKKEVEIPKESIEIITEEKSEVSQEPVEEDKEEILPQEDTSQLSNKKIGWYFMKGKDHAKPTFGKDLTGPADKYDAIYLFPGDEKIIYLTFDEGYENGYTAQILDILKEKNVKATFFITGPYLEKEEELVRRMVEEGHTVGNHTINHLSMPDCDDDKVEKEVLDLDRKFYDAFGISMKYLRPPMGEFSERTLSITKSLGYTNVFWSFAYRDWEVDNQKGTQYAVDTVLNSLHPGEVMLLHAVSKDNANALATIIDEARNMGYEFGEL